MFSFARVPFWVPIFDPHPYVWSRDPLPRDGHSEPNAFECDTFGVPTFQPSETSTSEAKARFLQTDLQVLVAVPKSTILKLSSK